MVILYQLASLIGAVASLIGFLQYNKKCKLKLIERKSYLNHIKMCSIVNMCYVNDSFKFISLDNQNTLISFC
jgi:hypothetical protein